MPQNAEKLNDKYFFEKVFRKNWVYIKFFS